MKNRESGLRPSKSTVQQRPMLEQARAIIASVSAAIALAAAPNNVRATEFDAHAEQSSASVLLSAATRLDLQKIFVDLGVLQEFGAQHPGLGGSESELLIGTGVELIPHHLQMGALWTGRPTHGHLEHAVGFTASLRIGPHHLQFAANGEATFGIEDGGIHPSQIAGSLLAVSPRIFAGVGAQFENHGGERRFCAGPKGGAIINKNFAAGFGIEGCIKSNADHTLGLPFDQVRARAQVQFNVPLLDGSSPESHVHVH